MALSSWHQHICWLGLCSQPGLENSFVGIAFVQSIFVFLCRFLRMCYLSFEAWAISRWRRRSHLQNCSSQMRSSHLEGSCSELLVDADTHGIDEIRSGIELLKLEMGAVHTTIFASPGRSRNTKWQKLFQEAAVSFHPVPRSSIRGVEANDDAIIASVRKLCRSSTVTCIALLVSDNDYAAVMQEAMHSDKVIVAVCPAQRYPVISTFEEIGVRVLKLPQRGGGPKVRAILDEKGGGYVHLAEPFLSSYQVRKEWQEERAVSDFLVQLGYRHEGDRYMLHQMAKFWFTNALGALTVFPQGLATKAVFELVERSALPGTSWKKPDAGQAFFLPRCRTKRATKTRTKQYGSALACSIFEAGGPFLLQDSKDLIPRALRRLGYLDSSLNNDVAEALWVFINNTANKGMLRKLDALPSQHDQASAVQEAVRHVFLSDQHTGQWRVAPKDVAVSELLCREGFLRELTADRSVVFEAMRNYAITKALPDMKSYLGYSFRIMTGLNPNPTRRGLVEFQL